MKKILFIGPYQSGTGYGNALLEYIYSAKEAGLDVACRRCKMTNDIIKLPDDILQLENTNLNNVDAVFQYNLPSEFQYKQGVINIGSFAYETLGVPFNFWKTHIKLVDKLVHPCNMQKSVYDCIQKGTVIPHSVNKNKYTKSYEFFEFNIYNSAYKFYTISELNTRKNLPELLLSYFNAFTHNDDVLLVIKINSSGKTSGQASEELKKIIEEMKVRSGINRNVKKFPKIAIISEFLTEEKLASLHLSCDTFVTMSRGESWCNPAIDAIAFGNKIIAPNFGAFKDYNLYSSDFGDLIDGSITPALGNHNAPMGLYSSKELWFRPNIEEMSELMLKYFTKNNSGDKIQRSNEIINNLSRVNVGNKIKELII